MKVIKFRPLRRLKSGKVAVAGYNQWYKVKCADYDKFQLLIDETYNLIPDDELVYNHKGENLFWINYKPNEIPLFYYSELKLNSDPEKFANIREKYGNYAIDWESGHPVNYRCDGLDCNGTPAFSHNTANDLYNGKSDMTKYEPLTAKTVKMWFGWFLYNLKNSKLI